MENPLDIREITRYEPEAFINRSGNMDARMFARTDGQWVHIVSVEKLARAFVAELDALVEKLGLDE